MSYDLFIRRPGATIQQSDLYQACSGMRWFDSNDEGEIVYRHPDTEVTFFLQHVHDHVLFNMNMARPPYWAQQAMPALMAVVNALGALVVDPQARDAEAERVRTVPELIESWEVANRFGLSALLQMFKTQQDLKLPHLRATAEQQAEWFDYMVGRWQRLAQNSEIWWPRIHWVGAPRKSGELVTAQRMVVWNPKRTLVLPQVELVHLTGLGSDRVVPMKSLLTVLADEIFDISDDVPLWRCPALDFDGRTALATLEGQAPAELELRPAQTVLTL